MIRRSPCELYIKYLICHPNRYTDAQIKATLISKQLDYIGEGYLAQVRATVTPPVPFYPGDVHHARSQRFLIQHKIRALFHPTEDMKGALAILENARAKEHLETMLLSQSTFAWAASALKRLGTNISIRAVELYKLHFWDIDKLDSTEIKTILKLRTEPTGLTTENTAFYNALTKAARSDPRILASESPVPAMANMINIMRMGFMPSNVELSRVLSVTRAAAAVRSFEEVMRGGPYASNNALNFAGVARTMHELLEALGSPEEDLQHQLSMMLRTDESSIPELAQLSDGKHTIDMQPGQEKPEVIDVESE